MNRGLLDIIVLVAKAGEPFSSALWFGIDCLVGGNCRVLNAVLTIED